MQQTILSALFVIEYKVYGDLRAAGPTHDGWLVSVADDVSAPTIARFPVIGVAA